MLVMVPLPSSSTWPRPSRLATSPACSARNAAATFGSLVSSVIGTRRPTEAARSGWTSLFSAARVAAGSLIQSALGSAARRITERYQADEGELVYSSTGSPSVLVNVSIRTDG